MRQKSHSALLAATAAVFLASTPVLAQAPPLKCPDGKTADGKCANGAMMRAMQQRAIVFTQAKLSYTGVPVAQGSGAYVDHVRARDQQDLRYDLYGPNPNGAAAPPGTFIRLPAGVNPASLHLQAPFTVVPGGIIIR